MLDKLLRLYWTQHRVNLWLYRTLPKGAVLASSVIERARHLGIPIERLVVARDRHELIIWDGDGHHLTMWMRRDTPRFERLP